MESAALMKRASCGVVLLLLIVSPALSGPLNGDPSALPGFTGTTAFNNGVGLSGTVDYAVYTYAAFQAEWAGLGYVATPGEAVYVYQVLPDPASFVVSHLSVKIINPADNIGNFALGGGVPPTTENMVLGGPPSADYFFGNSVPAGGASRRSGFFQSVRADSVVRLGGGPWHVGVRGAVAFARHAIHSRARDRGPGDRWRTFLFAAGHPPPSSALGGVGEIFFTVSLLVRSRAVKLRACVTGTVWQPR